jgi:valyl-tRNA synthetase
MRVIRTSSEMRRYLEETESYIKLVSATDKAKAAVKIQAVQELFMKLHKEIGELDEDGCNAVASVLAEQLNLLIYCFRTIVAATVYERDYDRSMELIPRQVEKRYNKQNKENRKDYEGLGKISRKRDRGQIGR